MVLGMDTSFSETIANKFSLTSGDLFVQNPIWLPQKYVNDKLPSITFTASTPSHACSASQNSVADLLLASDPALLVSAPALALVAGATKLSKMAAQCFLFHLIVLFMPHSKTLINTTDTSSPPSLSVGSLACLWQQGCLTPD